MRKSGSDYIDIANSLGLDCQRVKQICRTAKVRYGDLGDCMKPEHHGSVLHLKGITVVDWDEKIKAITDEFVLLDSKLDDEGERTLFVKCLKCGTVKTVSSISIRNKKKILCNNCEHEKTLEKNRKKRIEREREAERLRIRKENDRFFQPQMNFCECGKLLPFGRYSVCDECKRKTRRAIDRRKEYRRRTRINKEQDKSITLQKLFDKADGVCYICGKVCDWSDFQKVNGTFIIGGSYPTIDHVFPLSKGGTHTWDNVRLACFICNTKKGNRCPGGL